MLIKEEGKLIREMGAQGQSDCEIGLREYEVVCLLHWQKALEAQARQTDARTVEANRRPGQTFIHDGPLSKMEVLSIVRDINENVYQAAVSLTEEWRNWSHRRLLVGLKLIPLRDFSTPRPRLRPAGPRPGLTFLLLPHLCYWVVDTSSSRGYSQELVALKYVH